MAEPKIKKTVRKRKSLHKVDFESTFYSDIRSDNMLYGSLIRSTEQIGSIQSVSIPVLPDEYTIITANDIPGSVYIETLKTLYPVFAKDFVSYKGEPIGILVGPNPDTIKKLLNEVHIEFK